VFLQDAKVVTREPPEPEYGVKTWTGPGFVRVYSNSEIDFEVDRIYRSMDYDIHIRYEPQVSIDSIQQNITEMKTGQLKFKYFFRRSSRMAGRMFASSSTEMVQ